MSSTKPLKSDPQKEFWLSLWIILLSIPVTLLFPVIIILIILPVKLYSKIVAYLAHLTDPDKGAIITGLGAGQIRDIDVVYTKPRTAEVACLRMKGPLDFDEILDAFSKRVILKLDKSKNYPVLHYPELQQYFTKFLGYVFLKTDTKFDLKNHFTLYNDKAHPKPVTRKQLMSIWEDLMTKPFAKKRSAWEVVLIDNYIPDKDEIDTWNKTNDASIMSSEEKYWVAFIRMHHGLGDGFSVQKMLSYLADEAFMPKFSAKITPFQNFLMTARTVFLGPYDVVWRWYRGREDYHSVHLPLSEQSGDYFVVESKLISTKQVKMIKNRFKVPFTVILIAAISGGMRRYFLKYGIPIPKYLSTGIPLATLEHSDKLTNEFLLGTVEYCPHLDDPKARVEYVYEKMKLLGTTSWINMFNFIIDTCGSFPLAVFNILSKKQIFSSTYSTQPGPVQCLTSFGATLLEVNYSYGVGSDSITFGISTLTYNGNFRNVLFIDKNAVESRKAAEDIIEFIYEEFDVLEHYHLSPASLKEKQRRLNWKKSLDLD